jgi:hypothetical protein
LFEILLSLFLKKGIEIVLRDPEFTKVLSIDNCMAKAEKKKLRKSGTVNLDVEDEKSAFPVKANSTVNATYLLQLPYLEPSVQRSRYTLFFRAFGKKVKKENLQISIPLAVVRAQKLHDHISSQLFFTPLNIVLRRENLPVPKILTESMVFFQQTKHNLADCFDLEMLTKKEEENYLQLKEDYNFGKCSIQTSSHPKAVAKFFRFFFSLSLSLSL